MYKQFNANPKNKKTSDCVVRSFSLASGKPWDQTLTDLYNIAMQLKTMPNDKDAYSRYADMLGYKKCKVEILNGHKPTVKTFCESHQIGTFILRVANHITTVKNGYYYDVWDCGNKSVYMYWEVK